MRCKDGVSCIGSCGGSIHCDKVELRCIGMLDVVAFLF